MGLGERVWTPAFFDAIRIGVCMNINMEYFNGYLHRGMYLFQVLIVQKENNRGRGLAKPHVIQQGWTRVSLGAALFLDKLMILQEVLPCFAVSSGGVGLFFMLFLEFMFCFEIIFLMIF